MNTLSKNSIILTWIPSPIGIHGNEWADKAEKEKSTSDRHIQYKTPIP